MLEVESWGNGEYVGGAVDLRVLFRRKAIQHLSRQFKESSSKDVCRNDTKLGLHSYSW